ncbi:MAG TPA: GAF domain-containing protein [Anaerolineales bacterium]|nr:GAF domain-containing protein [Anaerolineales bacterium]
MKQTGSLLNKTLTFALFGGLFGLLFPILATLVRVWSSGLPLSLSSMAAVQLADPLLWIIDSAPVMLAGFAALAGRRQDALEITNSLLRTREQELERNRLALEERVAERTQALTSLNILVNERLEQLKSVAEITRSFMSIQDLDRLLPLGVQMSSQKFSAYHVGIYLLDEQRRYAVLMASSSEGGRQILQSGQRLRIGEQSVVEFAIRTGQPRIASDTDIDALISRDPELARTCASIVLPLKTGETVIGALDLHFDETRSFPSEFVAILSILADQLSIAIQNADLYERTQRTLREVEVNSRQMSASQWSGWVESIRARGYRYDGIRAEPLKETGSPSPAQTKFQSVPIRLRGRTIGHLKIKLSEAVQGWTEDELAIAEATADRAALALEGARLLDEAQKRAAREAFLSEMAAKLSTSFQMDSILRDTVEELGQTLDGSTVSFQLINPSAPPKMEPTQRDDNPGRQIE